MVTILETCQEFEGSGWVTYDTSYWQQMAITGNRDWSQSNGSLFTKCFTARARIVEYCELCLSMTHKARDYPGVVQDDRNIFERLKAIEAAVTTPSSTSKGMARPKSLEICQNFNQRHCFFRQCKYRHVCSHCRYNHPVLECPLLQGSPLQAQPLRRGRNGGGLPY